MAASGQFRTVANKLKPAIVWTWRVRTASGQTHKKLCGVPGSAPRHKEAAEAFAIVRARALRRMRPGEWVSRPLTEIERPAFKSFLVVDQHQSRLSELRRPAWPWWGALVDTHAVRAAFDAQIRRNTRAGEQGAVVEADAGVLRWLAPGTQTSRITWSELTSGSADAVIAAQVLYFAARGTPVEWKLYDYYQPADLAQRLLAAGFVADDEELMLVAEPLPSTPVSNWQTACGWIW